MMSDIELWCPGCQDGIHWPWTLWLIAFLSQFVVVLLVVGWQRILGFIWAELYNWRRRRKAKL